MKQDQPDPQKTESFLLIKVRFVFLLGLAGIIWFTHDFVASFAAREYKTQTTLRTTAEKDDARVLRAFKAASQSLRIRADIQSEPNPQQRTRDAVLTFIAPSEKEVLAERQSLVTGIQTAFAQEGPGELFDIGSTPFTSPVQNATMGTISLCIRGVAVLIGVLALLTMFLHWKQARLPKGALFGILASAATLFIIATGREGRGPMWSYVIGLALPVAFVWLLIHLTRKIRRAATWQHGVARITESKVETQRHRFSGDTTNVKNIASVTYDFMAAGKKFTSDKITLGMAPADRVDQTLKTYAVGREVPVFYDPANPTDCVLERDPPVSLGCLWTGAIVVLLLYAVVVIWLATGASPFTWVGKFAPGLHHSGLTIGTALFGLLALATGVWTRLHPSETAAWVGTPGTIVSSETESFRETNSTTSDVMRTFYKAVIEFSYVVDGKEYHSIKGSTDVIQVKGTSQASANAEVARYPKDMKLEVFYDPSNPTRASLTPVKAIKLTGTRSFIVAAILLSIAAYAATH